MKQETRTARSLKNMMVGFLSRIILIILPFVNRTIIIWYLGTEYLGLSSLFTSILSVLNLSELGIGFAVVYNMYGLIVAKDEKGICSLLNFYKKVYGLVGAVIFIIGIILLPFLPFLIQGDVPININIYVLYCIYLLQTISSFWVVGYKSVLLSAHQRADLVNGIQTLSLVGQQLTQVIMLMSTRNFYFYAIMCPIWTIINNLVVSLIAKRKFPQFSPKGNISNEEKKKLKVQVSGLLADRVSVAIRNSTDNIVISSLFGLTVLAQYSNYYYIMYSGVYGTLLYLMQAVQASIGDSIAGESVDKNYNDFIKINFLFSWVNVISTACLFGLIQPFIGLWLGDKNVFSDQIMFMICAYCYVFNVTTPINPYMDGNGLWDKVKTIVLVSAILNVILDIILGKWLGISGIIMATIISLAIPYIFFRIYYLYKCYFVSYRISLYYKMQGVSLLAALLSCSFIYFFVSLPVFHVKNKLIFLLIRLIICFLSSNIIFVLFFYKREEFKDGCFYILNHLHRGK